MSVSRKRKAEEETVREYSSETAQQQQGWIPYTMGFVDGVLARLGGVFEFFTPRQVTNTTTRTTEEEARLDRRYVVPAQNEIHSNKDGKRRKTSPDTIRQTSQSRSQPRPIADRTKHNTQPSSIQSQSLPAVINNWISYGGLTELDIQDCKTSEEARKKVDLYWDPPDLRLGRRKSIVRHPNTSVADGSNHNSLPRSHSDPADTLRDPHISPPYELFKRSPAYEYWKPQHQSKEPESPDRVLDTGDEYEDGNQNVLPRSAYKQRLSDEKRAKAEKERRERQEQEEKKRREDALKEAQEARLRRRKPASALIQPLPMTWDVIVTDNIRKDRAETIAKSEMGTPLMVKDLATLLGDRAWLNDEIINAYLEWVVAAGNEAAAQEAKALGQSTISTVPKYITHNSFFYDNIRNKGPNTADRLMKRKKAPGNLLLQVDTVLVPICSGNHWTIGVVRPLARTIEYFDSMGYPGMPAGVNFIRHMRAWLKHQLKEAYVDNEWSEPDTRCAHQSNAYDCGVFVCTNGLCVVAGLEPDCYLERDMVVQRRRIAAVLINRGFKGHFAWRKGLELP